MMSDAFQQQLALLPAYLGAHLTLSLAGLSAGIAVSLPLAVAVAKREAMRWPVLAVVGGVQTIPSLALLALMVPLLDAFGFIPAVAALTVYSMLPVVRNTVTGIAGVDPGVVDAARGMGMTSWQVLGRVELPLAAPVIVAGIRTSAVWVVGIATLSTPVGQTSLGNYIFSGLQTRNWDVVLLGCAAATALALLVDGLIATVESGIRRKRRTRIAVATGALACIFTLGVLAPTGAVGPHAAAPPAPADRHSDRADSPRVPEVIRIGAKTFTEQYILAALIADRLRAAGKPIERVDSLGSTVAFDALVRDDIHVYVDYTGTIWANHLRRTDTPPAWMVEPIVAAHLATEYGVRQLCRLGFENAYAFAMRRDRAAALDVRSLADLAGIAPELALGSDYEFFGRPEWAAVRSRYGLAFAALRSFDSTFLYDAVARDEVGVITAFSSDGRIDAYDLLVLDDPLGALPPYDAAILLSPAASADAVVVAALTQLCDAIPVGLMRQANGLVDREADKRTPRQAARWLGERLPR